MRILKKNYAFAHTQISVCIQLRPSVYIFGYIKNFRVDREYTRPRGEHTPVSGNFDSGILMNLVILVNLAILVILVNLVNLVIRVIL